MPVKSPVLSVCSAVKLHVLHTENEMQPHTPSRTALAVAIRRARHQQLDRPPVLDDPLALRILPAEVQATLAVPDAAQHETIQQAFRAFMAVRSRFAEDTLADSAARGLTQYVLLGAGLDTFPYRNPFPSVRTFEVDHPATQAWKRDLLAAAQIPIPAAHTFAPCDFERDTLPHALAATGFDSHSPALFAWLGVVPYLTLDAFRTTLRYLGTLPSAAVIFDFAVPPESLPLAQRRILEALAARVAAAGEPFKLYLSDQTLAAEAHAAGFPSCKSLSADDLNPRYFANRTDGLRLYGAASRIAHLSR